MEDDLEFSISSSEDESQQQQELGLNDNGGSSSGSNANDNNNHNNMSSHGEIIEEENHTDGVQHSSSTTGVETSTEPTTKKQKNRNKSVQWSFALQEEEELVLDEEINMSIEPQAQVEGEVVESTTNEALSEYSTAVQQPKQSPSISASSVASSNVPVPLQRMRAISTDRFVLRTNGECESFDGTSLYCQIVAPDTLPKYLMVICPGFYSQADLFKDMSHALAKEGCCVVSYDQRGFGKSGGSERAHMQRVDELVTDFCFVTDRSRQLLEQQFGPSINSLPIYLYGHSTGAFTVLSVSLAISRIHGGKIYRAPFILSDTKIACLKVLEQILPKIHNQISGCILASSYLKVHFSNWEAMKARVKRQYLRLTPLTEEQLNTDVGIRIEQLTSDHTMQTRIMTHESLTRTFPIDYFVKYEKGIQRLLMNNRLLNDFDIPLLVLHGSNDTVVDPSCSFNIHDFILTRNKTMKLFDDLQHDIHLASEKSKPVFSYIMDWIRSREESTAVNDADSSMDPPTFPSSPQSKLDTRLISSPDSPSPQSDFLLFNDSMFIQSPATPIPSRSTIRWEDQTPISSQPQPISTNTISPDCIICSNEQEKSRLTMTSAKLLILFSVLNLIVLGVTQALPIYIQLWAILVPSTLQDSITVLFLYAKVISQCCPLIGRFNKTALMRSIGWSLSSIQQILKIPYTIILPGVVFSVFIGLIRRAFELFYAGVPGLETTYIKYIDIARYGVSFFYVAYLIMGIVLASQQRRMKPSSFPILFDLYTWGIAGSIVIFFGFAVYVFVDGVLQLDNRAPIIGGERNNNWKYDAPEFIYMLLWASVIYVRVLNWFHISAAILLNKQPIVYILLRGLYLPILLATQTVSVLLALGCSVGGPTVSDPSTKEESEDDSAWILQQDEDQDQQSIMQQLDPFTNECNPLETITFIVHSKHNDNCSTEVSSNLIRQTLKSLKQLNQPIHVLLIHEGLSDSTLSTIQDELAISQLGAFSYRKTSYMYNRAQLYSKDSHMQLFHVVALRCSSSYNNLRSRYVGLQILNHKGKHFPDIVANIPSQLRGVPDTVVMMDIRGTLVSDVKTLVRMRQYMARYPRVSAVTPSISHRSETGRGFLNYVITLQNLESAYNDLMNMYVNSAFDIVRLGYGSCVMFRTRYLLQVLSQQMQLISKKKNQTQSSILEQGCLAAHEVDQYLSSLLLRNGWSIAHEHKQSPISIPVVTTIDRYMEQKSSRIISEMNNELLLLKNYYPLMKALWKRPAIDMAV